MRTIRHDHFSKLLRFRAAYWRWLRRERIEEPQGPEFDLDDWTAETQARLCHAEFERRRVKRILDSLIAA